MTIPANQILQLVVRGDIERAHEHTRDALGYLRLALNSLRWSAVEAREIEDEAARTVAEAGRDKLSAIELDLSNAEEWLRADIKNHLRGGMP